MTHRTERGPKTKRTISSQGGGKHIKKKKVCLFLGPVLFLLAFIPVDGWELKVRLALGTVLWMGVWWVTMPVSPAITAFLPVVVNALFSLTEMASIISCYSAELIFLLAGADLITMAWEATGVDKRIAAHGLALVGTSVKQQVLVWFLMATLLSAVLPNTVVAAVLCSIAISMLRFVGEGDVKNSRTASLVLMAIVWGANNGGMITPLGGAMNLVTVSYIESYTGREFIYTDWVIKMLPFAAAVTLITAVFLLLIKSDKKTLDGSKAYFKELCSSFPRLSRAGRVSLSIFVAAAALAFTRQLFQGVLPGLKPGFVFLIGGLLMFFLKDERGEPVITWEKAEKNLMWGLFFLFAGGTALGALVNGSGAAEVFAELVSKVHMKSEFVLILIIVTLNVVLSDIINNTACAAVTIPIVIGIAQGLELPVIPYLWIATVSYNLSFSLPTSIRAIPIGYGLDPGLMFKKGVVLTAVMILAVSAIGWLCVSYWSSFGVLS